MQYLRLTLELRGVLQGVGFRPSLKRLADESALSGWVQNRAGTVRLCLEGEAEPLARFVAALPARLPPRARLDALEELGREEIAAPSGDFRIAESDGREATRISIPADLALCPDCAREIRDPASRFFGYPFTTCTNCGPRYTVVDGMPYDRERTALKAFPLCAACQADYEDWRDRRFHAESIACPVCGPRLALHDAQGRALDGAPLAAARRALAEGAIVAVRGLGGFLLALDAHHRAAIARLRERKHRPHKPFAVMAPDLATVARYCELPEAAAELLQSPVSPIAVLDVLPGAALPLDLLSPDSRTLGMMLPTTPLHELLFAPLPGDPTPPLELLVMTSGNRGGEPICLRNDEAFERLAGIADLFLVHDREINLRNDDSLVAFPEGRAQVWRRARGYAPDPVRLSRGLDRVVLAMGAELKNTIALGFDDEVVLSPHIGDLATPEALDGLAQVVARFPDFFRRAPQVVAVDLHPDMQATRLGRRVAAARGLPVVEVQHHHAHAAAAMAEHGLREAIALVYDGTGMGLDARIWGAECLRVGEGGFMRLATFAPVPLPGGDAAVRHPARQVVARCWAAGLPLSSARLAALGASEEEAALWRLQCERGLNAPLTYAAGRLFDAFAALIGVAPTEVTWEGQGPVRLEALARGFSAAPEPSLAPFTWREEDGLLVLDWRESFARHVDSPPPAPEAPRLAAAFHASVAEAVVAMARRARAVGGEAPVVLSGGVFMNRTLSALARRGLEAAGFAVYLHRLVPPNDGGVALGQALVAGTRTG